MQAMKIVVTVASLLAASAAWPTTLAYWRFEEGSGTHIGDSSGHGNDGTPRNGAMFIADTPGIPSPSAT
jgi:hypothetical protein